MKRIIAQTTTVVELSDDDRFIRELEEGLQINKDALDDAAIIHADLFYQVSSRLQLAISRRDAAEQHTKQTEAEVDAKIRHDAEHNDEKLTETNAKMKVRLDPKVVDANEQCIELNRVVGQLSALKDAYSQRSFMLRAMVDLYVAGYFSEMPTRTKERDAEGVRQQMNRMRRVRQQ